MRSLRLLLVLAFGGFAGSALASEPRPLRILDSQEVDLGDRKILYNRLEAPILKPRTKAPASTPATKGAIEEPPSDPRPCHAVFLSVTTHPGGLSHARWHDGSRENVVWSNIDFRDFGSVASLETPAAVYSIFLIAVEITAEDVAAGGWELPPSHLPPASRGPGWIPIAPLSPEATQMMNDFHEFHRLNAPEILTRRLEQEKATQAHAEWLKANPQQPKDSVVNFFPIRSDYGNAREEAK
jgi:hypothetical protein